MLRILSIPSRTHENRYFALLADALERRGHTIVPARSRALFYFGYDVLHLNFPTHHISEYGAIRAWSVSALFGAYLLAARACGRRIVYTVHDLTPLRPRHAALSRLFLRFTNRVTNCFVFLSASSREAFVQAYPESAAKPWVEALHGPYPVTPLPAGEREERRRRLLGERPAFLVGFVGAIKPYKNLPALLGLPQRLADGRPVRVLVAGRAEAGTEREVDRVMAAFPPGQAVRVSGPLPDAEMDAWIQCADILAMPYLRGTNSGMALLALSNGQRLIGSGLPIFAELAATVGAPWVYSLEPGQEDAMRRAVEAAAAAEVTERDRAVLRDYLRRVGWEPAAAAVSRAYAGARNGADLNLGQADAVGDPV